MSIRTLKTVLANPSSRTVGAGVVFVVLSIVAIVPNLTLLAQVAESGASSSDVFSLFLSLYGSLITNQSLLSGVLALLVAILSGVNVALLHFYITKRQSTVKNRVKLTSVGGFVAGVFGIGCAACGSVLLSSILLTAGGASLAVLPLKGVEISLLGIGLLLYAINRLLHEIEKGAVC